MFVEAYIEAMLFAECDDNDEPLDKNYCQCDLSFWLMTDTIAECNEFQQENWHDIKDNREQAGHDFWLTRNGHGCGFWDGDWPEKAGERLTKASKEFGEVHIYTDSGLVHVMVGRRKRRVPWYKFWGRWLRSWYLHWFGRKELP